MTRVYRYLLLALSLLLVGCASLARAQVDSAAVAQPADSLWIPPSFEDSLPVSIGGMDNRLDSLVRPWLGTRHRTGGQSKDGIDCSGFVQVIMQEYLNYKTARSSAKNFEYGVEVVTEDLQPGDIVFFRKRKRIYHSGVWIGNGRFAHSSTTRGVIVTELEKDKYWRTHYAGAKRYLVNPAYPGLKSASLSDSSTVTTQAPAHEGDKEPNL